MGTVSCIIPSRNRPDRLRDAIESVQEQTHDDVEIIVVHEPADEATAGVVDDYSTAATEIIGVASSEESPMQARNAGIDKATGEYVAFLDDDDTWHPEKIETQLPYAENYSLVTCLPRIIRPESAMVQPHEFSDLLELTYRDVFDSVRYFPGSDSIGVRYLIPSCTLAKTASVRSIDGFREHHHEWDFYLRLVAEFGPAAVLEQPLVDFDRTDMDRYSDRDDVLARLERTFDAHEERVDAAVRHRVLSHLYFTRYRRAEGPLEKLSVLATTLYHDPSRLEFLSLP